MRNFALLGFLNYTLWVVIAFVGGVIGHHNVPSFEGRLIYGLLWAIVVFAAASWPKLYKFLRTRYGAIVRIHTILRGIKGEWHSKENDNALYEIGIIVYLYFFHKDK